MKTKLKDEPKKSNGSVVVKSESKNSDNKKK